MPRSGQMVNRKGAHGGTSPKFATEPTPDPNGNREQRRAAARARRRKGDQR